MEPIEKLLARALILVAHPDDETIGAAGIMQRTRDAIVVFATDGAPLNPNSWQAFGSREAYVNERKNEALQALDIIGIQNVEFLADRAPETFIDQELYWHLEPAFSALADAVRTYSPGSILTLAYEGGHPDHDCCAFLGAQLGKKFSLPVWEMPLYHRRGDGQLERQNFLAPQSNEQTLELSPAELELKKTMLQTYVSQREVLKDFGPCAELFRSQAAYDFSKPPHHGTVNYEVWNFAVKPSEVCEAFSKFLGNLGNVKESAA